MTYWQYRKAMCIIERFNGFVTGAELCCRHCGESARFNPGGLFDEDNYECPHCGTVEKYCYYIPMTIKDYLFMEKLDEVEFHTTPTGLYAGARIKISNSPAIYVDTAKQTFIIDSDKDEDDEFDVDIERMCRKIDDDFVMEYMACHRRKGVR